MPLKYNLEGQKYGKLTVIAQSKRPNKPGRGDVYWICRCDCGNIIIEESGHLRRGHATQCKQCGDINRRGKSWYPLDLVGQSFSKLKVIAKAPSKNRQSRWLCQCTCGNITVSYGNLLTRGRVTQCKECGDQEATLKRSGCESTFWKGGIAGEPKYCHKFNNKLKEKVREQFGRKCYICGTSEYDLPRKLHVHHIDYNKVQGCKGMRWALIPLCPSCHARTNTNRHFWFNYLYPRLIQDGIDNWGSLKVT